MAIRYDHYGRVGVVALGGDLRGDALAGEFRRVVGDALRAERASALVIDFAGARFIDGRGLEALLWSRAELGDGPGAVRLAGLDANCRTIIQMTRVDERFETHPDVRAALAARN
jgi:anti-anti-sigma factor